MDRILFIRLRLLGDIIFTIPSIQIFKKRFPNTQLYYVVEEKFKEMAALIPGIDQLIVIPRKMNIIKHWQFRKKIRDIGFDTVIDFHSGPKSAILTWISGANVRIGYKTPNRNYAYNRYTPRKFGDSYTHSVFNQAKLLEHLDIPIDYESLPEYPTISIDESRVRDFIRQTLGNNPGKKAVIHVGAGNEFRDWGIHNFSSLVQKLIENDWAIYLIGNNDEEKKKGKYLETLHQIHNLTGKMTIAETLYLISKSDVYVGADSGPLHLASLTSTPLVALYGPNIPEISGPWRKKNVSIIRIPMSCQPCAQRSCIYGIIPCMKNIKMDEIYETISRYRK